MALVWMRNKIGQTNGSVCVTLEGVVGKQGGASVQDGLRIQFRPKSGGLIGVPSEAVPLVLLIGPTSVEKKVRSVRTSGRAQDCGNIWEVADDQNPPDEVRKATWLEDLNDKRVA